MRFRALAAGCAGLVLGTGAAVAQMAVIDAANLGVARQNAENTRDIMNTSQQILDQNKKILEALSGDRTSDAQGNLANAALGGGNSISSAPAWGSILNGSSLSFGGLSGGAQNLASTLINGLQLVKSVSQALGGNQGQGKKSPIDSAYSGAMNTAALLTALTSQASQGVQSRSSSFQSIGSQIGSGKDVKTSIDQNTQMQVQTGQTINELIGVSNGTVAALNMENVQRLTRQSQTAKFFSYEPSGSNPFNAGR